MELFDKLQFKINWLAKQIECLKKDLCVEKNNLTTLWEAFPNVNHSGVCRYRLYRGYLELNSQDDYMTINTVGVGNESIIGTLPLGFRPSTDNWFSIEIANQNLSTQSFKIVGLSIKSNGNVVITASEGDSLILNKYGINLDNA